MKIKKGITNVFLLFALIIISGFYGCKQISQVISGKKEKTLVGVIRWDGWVGNSGLWKIGPIVERTLGPERFHYRAPFFSVVKGRDSISIVGTSQEIMDREIAYAKYAGIDYWAYCYYPDGCGKATEDKWNTHKNPNYAFVPFVTSGWDPRPIIEYYHGLPEADSINISKWYPKPAEDHYVQTATAD
jgi:hypothetical protein